MLYAVMATVTKYTPNGKGFTVIQVPTFYLAKSVQGIVNDAHAKQIAEEVINPTQDPCIVVNASVSEIEV